MNHMKKSFILITILAGMTVALAADEPATTQPSNTPTTQPTTQPAEVQIIQSDSEMARMFQTSNAPQPIQPESAPPAVDSTSGMAAVTPKAPPVLLRPEGYYVVGRLGRLGKPVDGFHEFIFDSDGQALRDPPMKILPNQLLDSMEAQTKTSADPMSFRISGYITVYKNRNYILIDKAVPTPRNKPVRE
jgi:hypothetical protein